MKKTVRYLAIIVLGVGLLGLSACGSQGNEAKSSSQIVVLANGNNLGDIPIMGGDVSTEFRLRNDGDEPVVILDGETSCMCTEAVIRGEDGFESEKILMKGHGVSKRIDYSVAPGEEVEVVAVFDPLAHGPGATGPIMRDVYLHTNSTVSPTVRLSFQGTVTK